MLRLPLIIDSSADVFICRTIDRAERELEPTDVRNGEYTGYDREGRLLAITTTAHPKPNILGFGSSSVESVRIEAAEESPSHAEELRSAILSFLRRIGVSAAPLEGLQLSELILEALPYLDVK